MKALANCENCVHFARECFPSEDEFTLACDYFEPEPRPPFTIQGQWDQSSPASRMRICGGVSPILAFLRFEQLPKELQNHLQAEHDPASSCFTINTLPSGETLVVSFDRPGGHC